MNSDQAFHTLETIASVSGTNRKQVFLSSDLMPYLKAAYDPFKQYYAKRTESQAEALAMGEGGDRFTEDTWYLLEMLNVRKVTGMAAHTLIDNTMSNMTVESAKLFARILNKDLRIGLRAKTINKVFPGLIPTHDIMLAKLFDHTRVSFPCWAGPKVDGVRAVFRKGSFYSRKGLQFQGLEHLEALLSDFTEPIDGELSVPGQTFQTASGMIRNADPTPGAVFHIFELPSIKMSFPDRLEMMEHLTDGEHIFNIEHLEMADHHMLKDFYEWCRKMGYEGTVVRTYDYQYVGTRSFHWMKMKPKMQDLECKVVGVFEGNGKYEGKMGGVIVEYHGTKGLRKVRVGGGFTDQQREDYWNCPSIIAFKYIQMEAMEETDDGSLRHPIFKEIKD